MLVYDHDDIARPYRLIGTVVDEMLATDLRSPRWWTTIAETL